jgi:hypothetical protein
LDLNGLRRRPEFHASSLACQIALDVLFRRRRIAEEFERAVPALPTVAAPAQPATANQTTPTQSLTPAGGDSPMKRIAADVVQRMTDSELRALNLPLGYVVDVMTAR